MSKKIYRLDYEDEAWGHISFMEHQKGAVRIPVSDESNLDVDLISIREFEKPKELFFASDYKVIPHIDFPKNNTGYVFSTYMLSVLKKVGEIRYREIAVVMFDHKEMEAYHIEDGELLDDLKKRNEDYVLLQLMEYIDAFDRDNSEYDEHFLNPKDVGYIDKLVLKEPDSGFPPIFKIKEKKSHLFITEEAKSALEAAGIKGCKFEEVEVSG